MTTPEGPHEGAGQVPAVPYPPAGAGRPGDPGPLPQVGARQGGAPLGSLYSPPEPSSPPDRAAPRARWGLFSVLLVLVAVIVGAGSTAVTYALVRQPGAAVASGGTTVGHQPATNPTTGPVRPTTGGTIAAAAAAIGPSVVTVNVAAGNGGGTGSGIVIRSDGYILTNNHVVTLDSQVQASATRISVTLPDGSTTSASVVGTDPGDDLAVIKVGASGLTAASFASSSALTVGQTVVAVGAPLGLSNTVTSGIVSALARPVVTGSSASPSIFDAVQTDAAINPGNSGGPLVDLDGHVVGVNSAIAGTGSGGLPGAQSGNIGIGFAIPSDEASRIATELISTGKATHAILGITVSGSQNSAGPTSATGARVAGVEPGSPAEKAGIQVGDVITQIGKQRIDNSIGAVAATRSHAPGATVQVTVESNGRTTTISVTLGSSSAP
jgi:putative serine protease PepD